MISDSDDFKWMSCAIALAEKGRNTTTPNPNVGCVIVKDGLLIGQGYHHKAGTGHAEVHALASAGNQAQGATAYVTLEPCSHFGRTPPCANALIEAGVIRVVCAMLDPNPLVSGQGIAKLQAAGIQTRVGVLEESAEQLNLGFLQRMRTGRPYVRLKMASSLDGATAMASGESQWITGPQARQDVQFWRARSCAIVTGVGTVIADDPGLNVRLSDHDRQPDRIILDTYARTPVMSKIVDLPGNTYIVHGDQADPVMTQALVDRGYKCICVPVTQGSKVDLNAFMHWLSQQQYNDVWIEAGANLAGSFLSAHLVDEVILYQAPKFMGANTRPLLNSQFETLAQSLDFNCLDVRMVGSDIRWRLQPKTTL